MAKDENALLAEIASKSLGLANNQQQRGRRLSSKRSASPREEVDPHKKTKKNPKGAGRPLGQKNQSTKDAQKLADTPRLATYFGQPAPEDVRETNPIAASANATAAPSQPPEPPVVSPPQLQSRPPAINPLDLLGKLIQVKANTCTQEDFEELVTLNISLKLNESNNKSIAKKRIDELRCIPKPLKNYVAASIHILNKWIIEPPAMEEYEACCRGKDTRDYKTKDKVVAFESRFLYYLKPILVWIPEQMWPNDFNDKGELICPLCMKNNLLV
ncbi:hypothetical protein HDV05_004336 [Chytridiales sp. JEL 0842]|nr:hypothetical protein HDV05_004336 [Chytridiales sp. JEL 0842]